MNMKSVARITLMMFAWCATAFSQNADHRLPAFDVASIKPSPPPQPGTGMAMYMRGGPGTRDPGLVTGENVSLYILVQRAYNLTGEYLMSGPEWMKWANFNISARVPDGTTEEQFHLMLQELLAERFALKVHHEKKEVSSYRLVLAKNGPHFSPTARDVAADDPALTDKPLRSRPVSPSNSLGLAEDGFPIIEPGSRVMGRSIAGRNRDIFNKRSMEWFADDLSGRLGHPVEDATGLKGEYDFSLYYVTQCPNCANMKGELANLPAGPTLIEAVEKQLGLKLEPSKSQVEILVIDGAEKTPTEN